MIRWWRAQRTTALIAVSQQRQQHQWKATAPLLLLLDKQVKHFHFHLHLLMNSLEMPRLTTNLFLLLLLPSSSDQAYSLRRHQAQEDLGIASQVFAKVILKSTRRTLHQRSRPQRHWQHWQQRRVERKRWPCCDEWEGQEIPNPSPERIQTPSLLLQVSQTRTG